ncbi:hypothetical protein V8246_16040 [Pseudoxanthomonas sp. F11]|uniref:hypothetical protein n=1 Tax=Pseudoxanthomonas sp. F11 TaxID=3126308 RepID=UPI00300CBC10
MEDVINIVGLPNGAHVRLRYNKAYVSQAVWQEVQRAALPDALVLVALGASSEVGSNAVAPLRTGRIVHATCQGQLLVLDVALSDYAYESFPEGIFWPELRSKASGLPEHFRSAERAPGNYVELIEAPLTAFVTSASVDAWEIVAQRVLTLDDLLHGEAVCIPFLYHLTGLPPRMQATLDSKGALTVDSGASVACDLHSLTRKQGGILRNPIGEVVLELSHTSATFVTTRRLRVDSSRDVKRLQMFTSTLFRRAHGHLSLRLIEFRAPAAVADTEGVLECLTPGEDRAKAVVARYDFPLVVGRWRPVVASLGLALSSALLAWDAPDAGASFQQSLIVPGTVGLLAFLALALGFWKEGGS